MQLDGFTVAFDEYGSPANPLLIAMHGLYGDSSTMAPLAELLADRFHVIVPDALGHGRSSHPAEFTLADQGRTLNRLAAGLGVDTAVLLGVSMGSYIAAQAAILDPARWSHLVLVVPKAHGKSSSTIAYANRMGFDLSTATPEAMMEFLAGALWSPDTPQSRRDEVLAGQTATGIVLTPEERAAIEGSLAGFDLRPELSLITASTLVISGRSDGLNPPAAGEELAGLIPGARFEIFEHSGHMLAVEEAAQLVAEVERFVLG